MRGIIGFAIVALCVTSAQAYMIDDFTATDPAGGWTLNGTTLGVAVAKSETGLPLSNVFGGTRDTSFTEYGSLDANMVMGYSAYYDWGWEVQNNSSSSWSVAELTYDGGGGAGGLDLNLTTGTKLSVDRWFDHMGLGKNTVLSITLDDGAETATVAKIWSTYTVSNVLETEDFLFTDFLADNASLDLSSIDTITLYLETDQAGDYILANGLSTDAIPEPATIGLLGLVGLLFARKRK